MFTNDFTPEVACFTGSFTSPLTSKLEAPSLILGGILLAHLLAPCAEQATETCQGHLVQNPAGPGTYQTCVCRFSMPVDLHDGLT
jgi:hypothetical protein